MDGVVTFLMTKDPDTALNFYRDTLGWTFLCAMTAFHSSST